MKEMRERRKKRHRDRTECKKNGRKMKETLRIREEAERVRERKKKNKIRK